MKNVELLLEPVTPVTFQCSILYCIDLTLPQFEQSLAYLVHRAAGQFRLVGGAGRNKVRRRADGVLRPK